MAKKEPSITRQHLINFIKETSDAETYSFTVPGTRENAQKLIHRMRVELSRMRDIVRARGRVPRHFKMMLDSIVYNTKANTCTITLRRTTSKHDVSAEVDAIFDEIAGGRVIGG